MDCIKSALFFDLIFQGFDKNESHNKIIKNGFVVWQKLYHILEATESALQKQVTRHIQQTITRTSNSEANPNILLGQGREKRLLVWSRSDSCKWYFLHQMLNECIQGAFSDNMLLGFSFNMFQGKKAYYRPPPHTQRMIKYNPC